MKTKLFFAYLLEFLRDGYYLGIFLLVPFIAKDIPMSFFQTGSLQAAVNIIIMLLAIPTVQLLIRFGEIKLLLFSLLLYAIGLSIFSFVHSYITLLIAFCIIGSAFALYATISSHIRTTWFTKETRGKSLGKLMAVGDIAKVFFSVGIGFFAGLIGWKLISLSLGVTTGFIFLLSTLLLTRKIKLRVDTNRTTPDPSSKNNTYLFFFKQKQFLSALLTGSLDEGINAPFYVFFLSFF